MLESITCTTVLPVEAGQLFLAWLDSESHTAFTGAPAEIDPSVGGKFTAWDGYISGVTTAIETNQRIVQSWRATDFPEGSADSHLEILFESAGAGQTRITLNHIDLPEGQGEGYRLGWEDYYFKPMQIYFAGK